MNEQHLIRNTDCMVMGTFTGHSCSKTNREGLDQHVHLCSVNRVCLFMPPHRMMPGAYSFSVLRTCVHGFMRRCTNVRPSVRMCVRMYVHTYVRDPVRLRLRHLYQVKCLREDEDGPGWGHLCHIDTFLVVI